MVQSPYLAKGHPAPELPPTHRPTGIGQLSRAPVPYRPGQLPLSLAQVCDTGWQVSWGGHGVPLPVMRVLTVFKGRLAASCEVPWGTSARERPQESGLPPAPQL